jgi:hypothetical protein
MRLGKVQHADHHASEASTEIEIRGVMFALNDATGHFPRWGK